MPIIALDDIDDDYFNRKISEVHQRTIQSYYDKKKQIREFLSIRKNDPRVGKVLGDKKNLIR